ALEVAPRRLLALDRLEERLEVPLAEARRALSLDDLEEQRRAVLHRLRENLEQVAFVVAVHENAELFECRKALVDFPDARLGALIIRVRYGQELDAAALHVAHGLHDVVGGHRDVLDARPAIELEVFI